MKRCGGVAVVQAPEDAAYPEMPRNALAAVDADHEVPLAELGALLGRLVAEEAPEPLAVPNDLLIEARLTERAMQQSTDWKELPGQLTSYSCPECSGVLRKVGDEQMRRYRCHVGHAFSAEALLGDQDHAVEEALWVALRTLRERAQMLETMARDEHRSGRAYAAAGYEERARESGGHAERIQALLTRTA